MWGCRSPRVGAVFVQDIELLRRDELATIDSRLDGAETSKDANLFDVADDRRHVQPLQLRVDGVQAANEVLEEQFERLRQTDELPSFDVERRHLDAAVVDQLTGVVLRVARDRRRGAGAAAAAAAALRFHLHQAAAAAVVRLVVVAAGERTARTETARSRRRRAADGSTADGKKSDAEVPHGLRNDRLER